MNVQISGKHVVWLQVAALLYLSSDCVWNQQEEGEGSQSSLRGPACTSLGFNELRSHCMRQGLSRFKLPRIIMAQHQELPVNATGKIIKHIVKSSILSRLSVPANICIERSKL